MRTPHELWEGLERRPSGTEERGECGKIKDDSAILGVSERNGERESKSQLVVYIKG
jgi:hypothetical protein